MGGCYGAVGIVVLLQSHGPEWFITGRAVVDYDAAISRDGVFLLGRGFEGPGG
jgi:hypothetical protein